MSQELRNYTKAVYAMDAVVNRVPADQWGQQSPCDEWNAKEVLGHCVYGALHVAANAGACDQPGEMAEAERAGADPVATWGAARDQVLAALDTKGVLDQQVQGPFGPSSLNDSLSIMTMDLTTHSWDIAKATGQQTVVPEDLATMTYQGIQQFGDAARRPGIFGPEVQVDDSADIVTKLAAMAGRQV